MSKNNFLTDDYLVILPKYTIGEIILIFEIKHNRIPTNVLLWLCYNINIGQLSHFVLREKMFRFINGRYWKSIGIWL